MEEVKVSWKGNMEFDASVDNITIQLDAPQEGSKTNGMRPKPLILAALGGCTGMDIASLAKKMRVDLHSLEIDIEAQKSEEMPFIFTSFNVDYYFESDIENLEKIIKMVKGSQEKYCGVSKMLRKIAPVSYKIFLNKSLVSLS